MKKVLVVTNTPHVPTTSGYSQRVAAVVTALVAQGYAVRTLSIKPLSEPDVSFSPLPGSPVNLKARLQVFRKLLRTPSLSLFKWYSPKACDTLSEIVTEWQPEVVLLESSYLAPYCILFDCPVIFDLHIIESQLIENYAKDRPGLIGLTAKLESRLLERVESTIPQQAFGVATVSDTDRSTLAAISRHAAHGVHGGIITAPNGVNDQAFSVTDLLAQAAAHTAVFIGHLGWRPNIDGAKWLVNEVWPLVHDALPDARLQLIGRDPHHSVQELANKKAGVSVHGNVESVLPYLAQAAVATAPLWTAGGTRLKILEALGTATPVVATSLGALGLENLATPGVLVIEDDPALFASALIDLLRDPAKTPAARIAAEKYRWSNTLIGLVDMVHDAVK